MVFNLQGRRGDFGVTKDIHDELYSEITDSDTTCQSCVHKFLHSGPGFLNGGAAGDNGLAIVRRPTWRVSNGGINIFEGDGKVNQIKIETVNAPVLKLLFADGAHVLLVVKRVPELGDDE